MYRQSEKILLNSNTSPTCPYNMGNFGLLATEIVSLVWATQANFNGFRVLAALLHGTLAVSVSETLRRVLGTELQNFVPPHFQQRAPPIFRGRPSRWA